MAGEKRYYYKSMLVSEYCRLNYLDYVQIMREAGDPSKLVNGVTKQDRLDSILSMYELYKDIIYKDSILVLYVVSRGLKYQSVIDKIIKATNGDPTKVTDTVIDNVLFCFGFSDTKYYYEDTSLEDVAFSRGLSLKTLENEIGRLRRTFPTREVQDIVNEVVKKAKPRQKYTFRDQPLKPYCDNHYIDYNQLVNDANNIEMNPSGDKQKFIDDMLTEIEKYSELEYEGVLLITYCIQNKYGYYSVIKNFIKLKKEKPNEDNNILLKMAFAKLRKPRNLELQVEKKLEPKKVEPKKEVKEEKKEETVNYRYHGFRLKTVCHYLGTAMSYAVPIIKKIQDDENLSPDAAVEKFVLDNLKEKAYIDNELLFDYCLKNKINYHEIRYYMAKVEDNNLSDSKKAIIAIQKYKERRTPEKLKICFDYLREKKNIDLKELSKLCDLLFIDFDYLMKQTINSTYIRLHDEKGRVKKNEDYVPEYINQLNAVMLTWYFHDQRSAKNNRLQISLSKISTVLSVFENIESLDPEERIKVAKKTSLWILIALYKSGLYTDTDLLYARIDWFVLCRYADCLVKGFNPDYSEIRNKTMEAIDNCYLNNEVDAITYIDNYVRKAYGLPEVEPDAIKKKLVPKKADNNEEKKEEN